VFVGLEMGMDAPDASKPSVPAAEVAEIRDEDGMLVSDEDFFHKPFSGYKKAYLSAGFVGKLGQFTGEFR